MAGFIKGDIVILPFPFSDLSASKRRPAVVVAALEGNDVILCQITSQTVRDHYALPVSDQDFVSGGLKQASNIRPNRIFTADSRIVLYSAGRLSKDKIAQLVEAVVSIIRADSKC
ncbi:MAG: type II toxin-antitoxin system PemK/MazF family toxin [Candidatus Wallbacteria bacterium]|nr:type II toxin-antitoxin system PemK/MazF family toxin [Candidatus Wallbacteria bacterium]